ncbi:hypothetical protein JCM8097_005191 [Rhodosporidiobolus ruineniae]
MLRSVAALALAGLAAAQAPSCAYRSSVPICTAELRTGTPPGGNQSLAAGERDYLQNRRANVSPQLWLDYLNDNATGATGYTAMDLVDQQPKLGLAVSGGGLRASLYGVGTLSAFDGRNTSSNAGNLLFLADYLTGLSGGSWAISSVAMNDMEPIYTMVLGLNSSRTGGWLLDKNVLAPGGVLSFGDNSDYYDSLFDDVRKKADAGFPVSITDIWGRALALHFYNGTNENNFYTSDSKDEGLLWPSIKLTTNYQAGAMPFPIVVTTSRVSAEAQVTGKSSTVIPLNNTQFEITPISFGSFDPSLAARIPTEYMGTFLNNGAPSNSSACVNYFDNAGFVIGSSASLFNAIEEEGFTSELLTSLVNYLVSEISSIEEIDDSVALVANYPNSWNNFQPESGVAFESAGNTVLQITDGGENGENVPIGPLLVKAREVDIVVAIDASADSTYSWPNGTSLLATYERATNFSNGYTNFPPVPPTQQEFVDQGLTNRPTFFGCNSTAGGWMNVSDSYPILIYLPNAQAPTSNPYLTNTSTFKLDYDYDEVVGFLDSAHANAMKGFPNPDTPTTPDPEWPLCLKCAVVDRARSRAMLNRTEACQSCFNRYCWSDSISDALVNATDAAGANAPNNAAGGSNGASALSPLRTGGAAAVLAAVAGLSFLA